MGKCNARLVICGERKGMGEVIYKILTQKFYNLNL